MGAEAVRLPRTYDVGRLREDLARLDARYAQWQPQNGQYHNGEWTGLSLYAPGGDVHSAAAARPSLARPLLPTEGLAETPYIAELLNELACPKQVVRVLALPPGGRIEEHTDDNSGFRWGALRLHVPIVTHPDVDFRIDSQRCVWKEGELWYGDFTRVHSVVNASPIRRVHLVIDVEVNEFLLGLFPHGYVDEVRGDDLLPTWQPALELDEEKLRRFTCEFALPGDFLGVSEDVPGELLVEEKHLRVAFNGKPSWRVHPVSDTRLRILGYGPGAYLEIEREESGRIAAVVLVSPTAVAKPKRFGEVTRVIWPTYAE
jgi:hypothetical protein